MPTLDPASETAAPPPVEVSVGGQLRAGLFAQDDLSRREGVAWGEVFRLRPHLGLSVGDDFEASFEIQLSPVDDTTVIAREAMASMRAGGAWVDVGLVPLSDRFGDTLYSSDWLFRPLALQVRTDPESRTDARAALGFTRTERGRFDDPIDHVWLFGDVDRGPVGAGVVVMASSLALWEDPFVLTVAGVRGRPVLGPLRLELGLVGSLTHRTDIEGVGGLARAAGTFDLGPGEAEVLALLATADDRAEPFRTSFTPPMSLIDGHGYWSLTGLLGLTPLTDEISIVGYNVDGRGGRDTWRAGMATAQARYTLPLASTITLSAATGPYAPQDLSVLWGWDSLVDVTWRPRPWLRVDGAAAAAFGVLESIWLEPVAVLGRVQIEL
ncbi:MAG: hypothetical protein H6738_22695 [Alphaproteobacteria bacterium]|nr:hypothetical protein [Alphaproteobacteria bacterium]